MKWRVLLEVTGPNGATVIHEASAGTWRASGASPATVGLSLAEGKSTLAVVQRYLVRTQAASLCEDRRRCQRCGASRPIKDHRSRRLMTVFGEVEVDAPRFAACRRGLTLRGTLSPLTELMPDRCTPEYERVLARMGALLPYGRAVTLMSEFLPLNDGPAIETARRRMLKVGARLERASLTVNSNRPPEARTLAVAVDGGHVKSVRRYQMRSFEILLAHASNDRGQHRLFSSVTAEADHERLQLGGVFARPRRDHEHAGHGADRRGGRAANARGSRQSRSDPPRIRLVPSVHAGSARRPNGSQLAERERGRPTTRCSLHRDN